MDLREWRNWIEGDTKSLLTSEWTTAGGHGPWAMAHVVRLERHPMPFGAGMGGKRKERKGKLPDDILQ